MRKVLIGLAAVLAVVALVAWVVSWFRVPEAVETAASRPWPGGMGTLAAALDRFPPRPANAASATLTALAEALPKNEVVTGFVTREIERGEAAIGEPPALPDVSAMRTLLLQTPVVWERRDEEVGDQRTTARRALLLTAARALVASALAKGRANDLAAWEDLRAVGQLARSLEGHPQMMLQTAAFSMVRMINAVAWKLPLPAPAWFGELGRRDPVRPLLEAFQHQTASYWRDGAQTFPTKWLANSVEHDRRIAEEVFRERRCDVHARANELGVDLAFVWRRAFRFLAEREATANALRIREGQAVDPASRCTDGGWTFDGTTLRFSREIPTALPDRPMPLVLRFKR